MQSTDWLPAYYGGVPARSDGCCFWSGLEFEMFEMLEDVLNRTRKLAVLLTWIGGAVYVGYQSHFVAMESYDDLLVPAVMGLFIVFLLLAGAALISSQGRNERQT